MVKIGFAGEHPGRVLWEEYLKPKGISQSRFARDVDISFRRANELLNGKRGFTPDTALRVARYLGMSAEFWMNWQALHDLQQTARKRQRSYDRIRPADEAA